MMKTVLISGAAGNLGKATVAKFSAEGYRVLATVEPGGKLGYEVKGEVQVVPLDHKNESESEATINGFFQGGEVNAAILLVGGFAMGGIHDTTGESLKKMLSLNFETAYFAARPLFRNMMRQTGGGRIVLVGARPAMVPADGKNALAYALSKSLLFKLAEFLNAEAEKKVVTHVVVPGIIDTPANRAGMPSANFSDWVKPGEIAETLYFLCSANGSVIRDTVVKVYGNS